MARWLEKLADMQDEYEARLAEHEARQDEYEARHEAWQAENETKMNALIDAQVRTDQALAVLSQTVAELSRTVDRFLKSRTDGQGN